MELLYLWINRSDHNCIMQQEFNFSPLYKFYVNDIENPRNLYCEKIETINLFNSVDKGKINNITAVVGSNGVGKTTLLSFIANNDCIAEFNKEIEYARYNTNRYEHHKSIYVFIENGKFIVYYNLKEKLDCKFNVLSKNLYWNRDNGIKQLCNVRKQLIIYLTNSSFVPEDLLSYSKSDKTYNVNLHQRSMSLVAKHFYNNLFGTTTFDNIRENDDGLAWFIKDKRDDRNFQELLDIQYYYYLLENGFIDFPGIFKGKIEIYFENIISLIENKYHHDFAMINKNYNTPSEIIKKFFNKINDFKKHYSFKEINTARRKNITIDLYVNLIFEEFFYNDNFKLPKINFNNDIYEQINKNNLSEKFKENLLDIKNIDNVLSLCPMSENLIDNPDDLACSYNKVVFKYDFNFYAYINAIFKKGKSFALRYIRAKKLEMSSGERAIQNMFSWLVLIPKLDQIMGIESSNYTSKLILIDELDLYAHPEWQRRIMSQLINTINKIEKEKPVQIIITSHSPLILSDFPRQNIIYMNERDGKTIVDNNNKHKQSFGANIYTLLKEAFFLENGAVGVFAKGKIYNVYEELKAKVYSDNIDELKKSEYQLIINLIGDEFVRREMQRLFDKKYGDKQQLIINEIPKKDEELQKLKRQLENSLEAVKKMLGGGL